MRHFPDVCCLIYNPAWLVLPLCCLSCTTNPARLVLSLIYKTCMACSSLCHLLYTNPTSACSSCLLSSYTNLAQLVLLPCRVSFTNLCFLLMVVIYKLRALVLASAMLHLQIPHALYFMSPPTSTILAGLVLHISHPHLQKWF